jgi:hypothetical protein
MDAVDPNLELMKKAKFRKQPLLQPYTSIPSTIELKPGQIVVTPWLIPPSNIHKKPVYFYIQSVVLKPNGFTSMYGWRLSEQQKLTVRYEKLREEIADQYTYIVEENVSESRLNEEE